MRMTIEKIALYTCFTFVICVIALLIFAYGYHKGENSRTLEITRQIYKNNNCEYTLNECTDTLNNTISDLNVTTEYLNMCIVEHDKMIPIYNMWVINNKLR